MVCGHRPACGCRRSPCVGISTAPPTGREREPPCTDGQKYLSHSAVLCRLLFRVFLILHCIPVVGGGVRERRFRVGTISLGADRVLYAGDLPDSIHALCHSLHAQAGSCVYLRPARRGQSERGLVSRQVGEFGVRGRACACGILVCTTHPKDRVSLAGDLALSESCLGVVPVGDDASVGRTLSGCRATMRGSRSPTSGWGECERGGNVQKRQVPIAQGGCYDNWECRPSCGEARLRVWSRGG